MSTSWDQFLRQVELRRDDVPSFDKYPYCIPAIRGLHSLEFHPRVTFLIGENGSGKSTLLEAIAVKVGFNAEGGSKAFNFATIETHSEMFKHISIKRGIRKIRDGFFLRAESFYNVATQIDELGVVNSYGGRPLHKQSH